MRAPRIPGRHLKPAYKRLAGLIYSIDHDLVLVNLAKLICRPLAGPGRARIKSERERARA